MTTVLLQVSHGKRPCLDIIPEVRPQECNQMIRVMEQCWDQDHKKRPPFSGEEKMNLSQFSLFMQSETTLSKQTQYPGFSHSMHNLSESSANVFVNCFFIQRLIKSNIFVQNRAGIPIIHCTFMGVSTWSTFFNLLCLVNKRNRLQSSKVSTRSAPSERSVSFQSQYLISTGLLRRRKKKKKKKK